MYDPLLIIGNWCVRVNFLLNWLIQCFMESLSMKSITKFFLLTSFQVIFHPISLNDFTHLLKSVVWMFNLLIFLICCEKSVEFWRINRFLNQCLLMVRLKFDLRKILSWRNWIRSGHLFILNAHCRSLILLGENHLFRNIRMRP